MGRERSGADSAHAGVGVAEDGITLGVAAAGTETDAEPDRELAAAEQQDRGQHAGAKAQAGLHQSVGDDNIPLRLVFVVFCGGSLRIWFRKPHSN